ncbi:hypothetical protein BH09MYX1_BH09MYX1_26020 [soil metagenome]
MRRRSALSVLCVSAAVPVVLAAFVAHADGPTVPAAGASASNSTNATKVTNASASASSRGAAAPSASAAPDPKAERRSGLVLGASGGFALGTASGWPNESDRIGDPNFHGDGGVMLGFSSSFFVMGAFADVFNFGAFFSTGRIENGDWKSSGMGGGFRVEAFPFFYFHRALRDFGIMAQFGIGGANLDAKAGTYPGASGLQSFVSAGLFYEWHFLYLGHTHFALAPTVQFDFIGSQALDRTAVIFGARLAFYSGGGP